jgi:hypothetical protein
LAGIGKIVKFHEHVHRAINSLGKATVYVLGAVFSDKQLSYGGRVASPATGYGLAEAIAPS